jgi:autotransporter translocation and assembly factor TamB
MERETSRILGRNVTIKEFNVYLPNSFEIKGLHAHSKQSGERPWLEIESLKGELKLTGVIQRQLQFSLLDVGGLVLRVQDYGKGKIDLPGMWDRTEAERSSTPRAGLGFQADRIQFDRANFVYNNRNLPWQLEATELRVQLSRQGFDRYLGIITYNQGQLQIKNRPPFDGALEASLRLTGKVLRLEGIRAAGSFYEIQGTGDIQLGSDPQAEIDLTLESKVSPAAVSVLGLPLLTDAPSGSLATLDGHLSAGRGWHLLRGRLDVPEARFAGIPLRGWRGELRWDRSALELVDAEGSFALGRTQLGYRQMLPITDHDAQVDIQFRGVSLQDVLQGWTGSRGSLSSSIDGRAHLEIPAGAVSRLSGELELTGKAPEENSFGAVDGEDGVEDDEDAQNGADFELHGELEDGDLFITSASLRTSSVSASLDGAYPARGSAEMNLELDIHDVAVADRLQSEFRTILHPEKPAELLQIEGRGYATGRLEGRLPMMRFDGRFRGSEIVFRGVPFGNVEGQGALSPETLRFDAFRAALRDARIDGKGGVALGSFPENFDFHGRVDNWNVADIFELLTIPWQIEGRLSARGSVTSKESHWVGDGSLALSSGTWHGMSFDRADAESRFLGDYVQIDSLRVARGDATLEGRVRVDLMTKELDGDLAARNVPLRELMDQPFDLAGTLGAELTVSGTLETPQFEMLADIPEVRLENIPLGTGRLEARSEDDAVAGSVSIKGPELEIEARSQMRFSADGTSEGSLRWKKADLAPWLRTFRSGLPESLRLISDGEASLRGLLTEPDSWTAVATLTALEAEISGFVLDSNDSVAIRLENGSFEVEGLQLSGQGTEVQIHGKLPATGGNLDIHAHGSVNLGILERFYPSMASSGRVDLSARIRGELDHPELSGFADLSSGVFRAHGFPQAFGDVQGRILFDNMTIRAPDFQARFGGAPVSLSGTLTLKGLNPNSFEVSAVGRGLRLRYPEGLVATVDADLQMNGTMQSQLLSGRIVVDEAVWSREYDLATGILISQDSPGFELIDPADQEQSLANLRLDLEIQAPGTLQVKNSRTTVDAGAELQLRGTFARPALLGRAEALRGEIFLLGQKYNLVTGKVEFVDPSTVKPFFDVVAESRVRSYMIELRLTGTPDRFFPELSSDPPLRTIDIMRLLAGASERDVLIGSEEEEVAGVGVASLLTERLTQEVGRRAERLFGLDRVSIDPFLVGKFANPTARVSIGKQIYRDLSINYSTNLNETTETLILIEYTPEGPISWIFSRDEDGALGVDLRFRKSF